MLTDKVKLFSIPMMIMGLLLLLLGSRWIVVEEPWLLDKIANEDHLKVSFEELFEADINENLPDYLKQIYRFFGLWVSTIGLFILLFSRPQLIIDNKIRVNLLICSGVMIYAGLILGYAWIPKSPFIYLGWSLVSLHLISLYNHKKIK